MAYTERGYTANANNLATLNGKIKVLDKYNPSNASITKAAIEAKSIAINNVLSKQSDRYIAYTVQNKNRLDYFDNVESMATRIGGSYGSLDVPDKQISLVHNQVKLIRGERINPVKETVIPVETTDTDKTPATHSVSHTSFANLVRALRVLLAYLISTPEYIPNEADLTIDALTIWIQQLSDCSDATDNVNNLLALVDVERDKLFYTDADSAENLVVKVKNSVLAAYGATSTEYKDIKAIPFIDNRKKKKQTTINKPQQ